MNKMGIRDQEYIENRLLDPGPAPEACERLRKVGRADLADEVAWAARNYVDRLRNVRARLLGRAVEEFSGINSATDDPKHVEEVINHIAHLDEDQVTAIRNQLNLWHETAQERAAAERVVEMENPNEESGYDGPVAREGEVSSNHPAHPQWHNE
jgi:hypothetical protein